MTKQQIAYLPMLLGSVVFYIFYQEWFSTLLLYLAIGMPLLSLLISLPRMLRAKLTVDCPTSVAMHTAAIAKLHCSEELPFRGRLHLRRSVTGERWRGKEVTALPTDHCGALEVQARWALVYDLLGLISIPVRVRGDRRTLVRPDVVDAPIPTDVEKAVAASLAPKAGGGFSEYHELREYRPGDSLSHMHWKMTAKVGKPILREPMQPRMRLSLTLDIGGTAAQMDRKLGQLLFLSNHFLDHNIPFDIAAFSAEGVIEQVVDREGDLLFVMDRLLTASPADRGSIQDRELSAICRLYIGGDAS